MKSIINLIRLLDDEQYFLKKLFAIKTNLIVLFTIETKNIL